jgi:ABC-type oligopeptide transport system substrate-binding subunit
MKKLLTVVPRLLCILGAAAAFLLTACTTDKVTERTRLPYIDDKAPPSDVVPLASPEQKDVKSVTETVPEVQK